MCAVKDVWFVFLSKGSKKKYVMILLTSIIILGMYVIIVSLYIKGWSDKVAEHTEIGVFKGMRKRAQIQTIIVYSESGYVSPSETYIT